jgi:signal transduction histidine kinase
VRAKKICTPGGFPGVLEVEALMPGKREDDHVVAVTAFPRLAYGTTEIDPVRRDWDVAQVVQELTGPLHALVLETYLLDALVDGTHDDRAVMRSTLDRVIHDISVVDALVQDLADLCALDSGAFELERAPAELRLLIQHVVERTVAPHERPRVFLEAPAPITLAIDDARIGRVIAGYVRRTLAASARDTGIIIRLEPIGGGARVSVIGGITEAGDGLGLCVARRIIEAHGGRAGVETLRGRSTRHYFELPAT